MATPAVPSRPGRPPRSGLGARPTRARGTQSEGLPQTSRLHRVAAPLPARVRMLVSPGSCPHGTRLLTDGPAAVLWPPRWGLNTPQLQMRSLSHARDRDRTSPPAIRCGHWEGCLRKGEAQSDQSGQGSHQEQRRLTSKQMYFHREALTTNGQNFIVE